MWYNVFGESIVKSKVALKFLLFIFVISTAVGCSPAVFAADIPYVHNFLYHEIYTSEQADKGFYTTEQSFRQQMEYLKNNCNVIAAEDYLNLVCTNQTVPHRSVMITFDDGYLSNYTFAYPVLKELNLPALIFINTDQVGTDNHLTWQQIKDMTSSGLVAVGSHCKNHVDLTTLDGDALLAELKDSKEAIDLNLDYNCRFISYPYGFANNTVVACAREAGYDAGFVVNHDDSIDDKIFSIPRIALTSIDDCKTLEYIIFGSALTGLPGDISGDGVINNRDAARILQYLAGWDVAVQTDRLDVNGDSIVSNRDAARLLQYLAGWDVVLY